MSTELRTASNYHEVKGAHLYSVSSRSALWWVNRHSSLKPIHEKVTFSIKWKKKKDANLFPSGFEAPLEKSRSSETRLSWLAGHTGRCRPGSQTSSCWRTAGSDPAKSKVCKDSQLDSFHFSCMTFSPTGSFYFSQPKFPLNLNRNDGCAWTDLQKVEVVFTLRQLLQLGVHLLQPHHFLLQLCHHLFVLLLWLSELLLNILLEFGMRLP